jgi:hypothetical protein
MKTQTNKTRWNVESRLMMRSRGACSKRSDEGR